MLNQDDVWKIYKDNAGEYRWRRTAANGEIVGASVEGYKLKMHCEMIAERHGLNGNPNNYGSSDKWYFYTDKSNMYRWRRVATNGEIVGASSEGYITLEDCRSNAQRNGLKRKSKTILDAA